MVNVAAYHYFFLRRPNHSQRLLQRVRALVFAAAVKLDDPFKQSLIFIEIKIIPYPMKLCFICSSEPAEGVQVVFAFPLAEVAEFSPESWLGCRTLELSLLQCQPPQRGHWSSQNRQGCLEIAVTRRSPSAHRIFCWWGIEKGARGGGKVLHTPPGRLPYCH